MGVSVAHSGFATKACCSTNPQIVAETLCPAAHFGGCFFLLLPSVILFGKESIRANAKMLQMNAGIQACPRETSLIGSTRGKKKS